MPPYHRSSADKSTIYERNKSRNSHNEHASNNMPSDALHSPRRRRSYRRPTEPESSSSDEILIKGRASRRARRDADKNLSRQLRVISKAQREILRSSSSSKDKVHIHLVPVVSKSPSPEPKSRSSSESMSEAKSTRSSVSGLANQLMDITKTWLHRHSDDSLKSSPCSPRSPRSRPKHHKRGKHGKKRVSASQYFAPLAERWVCYGCGKLRSSKMQARYPLQEGQKMAPNYCGKCRVHGELQGRAINFEGKRNYCWGCGIIRSQTYNNENPVEEGGMCTPNYCKPCREASPKFEYKLHESSEAGSIVDIRDKAFTRQMHDAELSDVEDDTDSEPTAARGKENIDPKPKPKKQLKASKSFMLENFSYKVKTTSSVSSGDSAIPISILKALRLDEEPVRSTSGTYTTNTTNTTNSIGAGAGRCRLTSQTYQPPVVESEVSESSKISMRAVGSESPGSYYETNSPKKSRRSEEPSSPVTVLPYDDDSSDKSSSSQKKKKVHWYKKVAQPSTTADTIASAGDSAYYSNRFSEHSNVSTGSRRVRRSPAEYSTGSPPSHLGEATSGDLRETARLQEQRAGKWPQASARGFSQQLPTEGTFGQPRYSTDASMPSYRNVSGFSPKQDSTESPRSSPATSPEPHVRARASFAEHASNAGYERPFSPLIDSEVPYYSRSYQGLAQENVSPIFPQPFSSAKGQRPKDFRQPATASYQGHTARKGDTQEYPADDSGNHFGGSATTWDEEVAMRSDQYGRSDSSINEDYNCGWGDAPYVHEDARSSSPDSPGYNAASSSNYGAFDFSGFGATRPEPFAGPTAAPKTETFQRKKKSNSNPTQSSTPPKAQSWHLYDDGENGSAPNTKDCRWKKDGRTTVHRSGEREKTVQILHIREVDSDDETSLSEADNDEASEIATVIAGSGTMKSICAA